jgi:hypothetical protein
MYQTEDLLSGAQLPRASGRLYAGGTLPVWRPTSPGDVLRLSVPVAAGGEYRVHFVARLDPNGGVARVTWDGEAAELNTGTSALDFHRPHRTLLRDYTLSQRSLTAGTHTLAFVFDGASEGIARPEIGIDFVWVQEIR